MRILGMVWVGILASGEGRAAELDARLQTEHGAVRVWRPAAYDAATAGIVLYLHGYYTDVDAAWVAHALAAQFDHSGRNALFIAPESPAGDAGEVVWPRLAVLLETVRAAGIGLPAGPMIAVAHSGGYRTVIPWLEDPELDTVVLLDAMYGGDDRLAAWLEEGREEGHRLLLVAAATRARSERFIRTRRDALTLDRMPSEAWPSSAQVLLIRSEAAHMALVTEGKAIPALLQLTRLDDCE